MSKRSPFNNPLNYQVKHQAFWTKPHSLNNGSAQSITTYCIPFKKVFDIVNVPISEVFASTEELDT